MRRRTRLINVVRFHWACLDQCRRLQGDGGWKPELGATHAAGIVYLSASALFGCTSPPPDIGQRAVQASRHASPWRRAKALPQSRRSVRATSRTASVAEADAGDACSSRVPGLPRRQARPSFLVPLGACLKCCPHLEAPCSHLGLLEIYGKKSVPFQRNYGVNYGNLSARFGIYLRLFLHRPSRLNVSSCHCDDERDVVFDLACISPASSATSRIQSTRLWQR